MLWGKLYNLGLGVDQDHSKTAELYEKSASLDHISAKFNLGLLYWKGRGVAKNLDLVVKWWNEAAVSGHSGAQYNLAALLWKGVGDVKQDKPTAIEWFRIALKNNNEQAIKFINSLYDPMNQAVAFDSELASVSLDQSESGMDQQMNSVNLAKQAMEEGDFAQVFEIRLALAKDNHEESQYRVGVLLEEGKGVKANFEKALIWYMKAANAGQTDAQFRLGLYHMNEAARNQSIFRFILDTICRR